MRTASSVSGAVSIGLDSAARHRGADEVGARLDAVGQHGMRGAAQRLDAGNADRAAARALDFRAHRVQEARKVQDFGLPCGVLEYRLALGEDGCHKQVLRSRDRHGVENDVRALEPIGPRLDEAAFDVDRGPHGLEAGHVQVDRARADRAAAGQRNVRLAETRHERAQHEYRCAHRLDQFVGRLVARQLRGIDLDVKVLVNRSLGAQGLQQRQRRGDVLQVRDVADGHRFGGQQRAGQNGQSRVLGTGNAHLPFERSAASDPELVHFVSRVCSASSAGVRVLSDKAWISLPTSVPRVL